MPGFLPSPALMAHEALLPLDGWNAGPLQATSPVITGTHSLSLVERIRETECDLTEFRTRNIPL
jgi:hypothetical protein